MLSRYCPPEVPRMVATSPTMVVVSNLYVFHKFHTAAHLKRVYFTVCKLHLNKSDFKISIIGVISGKNRIFMCGDGIT